MLVAIMFQYLNKYEIITQAALFCLPGITALKPYISCLQKIQENSNLFW